MDDIQESRDELSASPTFIYPLRKIIREMD